MSVEHDTAAKIIVADDDSLVCNAVVQILEMFGYRAVGVLGGRELLTRWMTRSTSSYSIFTCPTSMALKP